MRLKLRALILVLCLLPALNVFSQPNNSKPEIVGQVPSPLTTTVNQPITIQLDHLVVVDADATPVYPNGFELEVSSGRNYDVDGATVTPDRNFTGMLLVPVRVDDGKQKSRRYELQIAVTGAVNVVPKITGQQVLKMNQGESLEVKLSHLTVEDPDDNYPADFTLGVSRGNNYNLSGNTITPRPDFTGNLTVPVTVNDGQNESAVFNLKIEVGKAQNVAPIITGQSKLTIDEEKPLVLKLSDLKVTDPDNAYPRDFSLIIAEGQNYLVSGTTVTPVQNFSGVLMVNIFVNDGQVNSPKFVLQVTVNSVNDSPVITGQRAVATLQNTSVTIVFNHLIVTDSDNAYPTGFTLKLGQGANYTVAGNNVNPSPGFTGDLSVRVTVSDGQLESSAYFLKISVTPPANVPPVISGQKQISIVQNASLLILFSHLTVTDPDNQYPTGFSLKVLPGNDYTVSGATIRPVPDFKKNMLIVKVSVNDGTNDSAPFDLKIDIVPVTAEPKIIGQKDVSMKEDASLSITLSMLEVSDSDNPGYPKGFSLIMSPTTKDDDYTVSGNTITPLPNLHGFIEVGVRVSDGVKPSDEFQLSIVVTPVNDAPEILTFETKALVYEPGKEPKHISETFDLNDVDSDYLTMAEIGFRPTNYSPANDQLILTGDSSNIKVINDPTGILFLVGYATLDEYKKAIRSIQYNYRLTQDENGQFTEILSGTRTIYVTLHDGQLVSETRERQITMETKVALDIPNTFTPNGDSANDTWKIRATNKDQLDKAIIRIYNKRGFLLYESTGFEKDWDGLIGGEVLPADSYFYTIDLNLTYVKQTYKGVVTILH